MLGLRGSARRGERTKGSQRRVADYAESQLNVELASVLVRRAGKHRLVAKSRVSGCDRLMIAAPMCGAQVLWNDEIERLADGLARRVSEERFRSRVPDADDAFAVCEDDGIGRLFHRASMQFGIRLKPAALLEQRDDASGGVLRAASVSPYGELGRKRRLVGRLHAGQRGGSSAAIEFLWIAGAAYFERRVDEHLGKALDLAPRTVPVGSPVGGRIEKHCLALSDEHCAQLRKRGVEKVALRLIVARKRRELRAQHVGLQYRRIDAARMKRVKDRSRDGALARAGESGEPDGEAHASQYALGRAGSKRASCSTFSTKRSSLLRRPSSRVGYQSGFAMTSPRNAMNGAATSRIARSPERSR